MRLVELLVAIVVTGGIVYAIVLRNKRADARKSDVAKLEKELEDAVDANQQYYVLLIRLYGIAERRAKEEPLMSHDVINAISTHPKFKHLLTTDGEQS
jgi:autonomous glycyl radical cofactor GrcA